MVSHKFHKTFKIFAWILGVILFLIMTTLTRVDRRDYQTMEYYQTTMTQLDSLASNSSTGEFWMAGWSKQNTTPDTPAQLMGYKPRGEFGFVQDSSYIRALLIGNGKATVAFLNYEMMIVHPHFYKRILEAVATENLPVDFVYFTATHTHSGLGGYIPGVLGEVAFGGYDDKLVNQIVDNSIIALQKSLVEMDTVSLSFGLSDAGDYVENRLVSTDPVDPFIRKITLTKKRGGQAQLLTFGAHPTIINSKFMGLSGDYPHYLSAALESGALDIALFAAGTVGSHRPIISGNTIEHAISYGEILAERSKTDVKSFEIDPGALTYYSFPLHLRKAHFRISENIRIRPWIFNSIMGDTNAHFDVVQFGSLLIINSSGEISGLFMEEWETYAAEKGLQLLVTSFNGGYIGYITPDEYYDRPLYEVRDMNWYGPQNGAYFDAIIRKIVDKSEELFK